MATVTVRGRTKPEKLEVVYMISSVKCFDSIAFTVYVNSDREPIKSSLACVGKELDLIEIESEYYEHLIAEKIRESFNSSKHKLDVRVGTREEVHRDMERYDATVTPGEHYLGRQKRINLPYGNHKIEQYGFKIISDDVSYLNSLTEKVTYTVGQTNISLRDYVKMSKEDRKRFMNPSPERPWGIEFEKIYIEDMPDVPLLTEYGYSKVFIGGIEITFEKKICKI